MLFRRKADGFSEVQPAWRGETAVILGCGPSLTRDQCDFVRGRARVVAINNAYLLAPWAEVLYFGDERWLNDFGNGNRKEFVAFSGERVTIEEAGKKPGDPRFHILRNIGVEGLSTDRSGIYNGRSSVYAAINWIVLAGVTRIMLLGCDFRHIDGMDHFEGGGHPLPTDELTLDSLRKHFRSLERPLSACGIEVVNATPGTKLETFPRIPLDLVRWFQPEAVAA